MINKESAQKIQQISDAYVRLVKKETGADMVCNWGMIDPKRKVIGTGFSMSNALENGGMESVYFHMQRNLFINLMPYEDDQETGVQ